ncbi:nuclear transport factor 2 family protein [Psychrobacillus sp. NEAU-3TGS]|uniref:nuclear transport factor 2 family protein n=1 Tax=Psychrobacillus sp. NEAU-3TGS TaxID=2995412 RepID=UPI0024990210|nr:nuclear transport factor 2 family protein [Psychrobacillus sp. NEAU-3TGS]MDI2589766.1 nuclear transport factor 2 family protein [Psychrobacillus sp. NEAU-3TGS]
MKIIHTLAIATIALLLAACSSNEDTNTNTGSVNDIAPTNTQKTTDHGATDKSEVGFEMAGGNIEEATNVPAKEKEAILKAFDEYMEAFNEEDINRYMNTISKNPEGFNYEDEKVVVEQTFNDYDTIRTADNTTIIKYDKTHAQVFANIHIALEQPDTGAKLDRDGRQVTVFVKEDGKWLVTSVYFIGDTATE